MREKTIRRLNASPNGAALAELLATVGGWQGLMQLTGCTLIDCNNFSNRAAISKKWAERIAAMQWAKELGWTQERIRPNAFRVLAP